MTDTIKICTHCNNVMIIKKDGITNTKYECILCKYSEDVLTTTVISTIRKQKNSKSTNPRSQYEKSNPLHRSIYRSCNNEECASKKLEHKKACFRKVIYDNGKIEYFCQDC